MKDVVISSRCLSEELNPTELSKKRSGEMIVKLIETKTSDEKTYSEIKINKILYNFTKKYLSMKVNVDDSISYTDALNEVVYLCQEKFGCGSEQTIRRYINQLTCGVARLKIVKDRQNKKQIIKRRLN